MSSFRIGETPRVESRLEQMTQANFAGARLKFSMEANEKTELTKKTGHKDKVDALKFDTKSLYIKTDALNRIGGDDGQAEKKLTSPEIKNAQDEVKKYGKSASDGIVKLMKNNRVLGIGESHLSQSPHRKFGIKNMMKLAKAGASHLALELPQSIQPLLDQFMKTGKISPELRDKASLVDMKLLDAARRAGLKLVAVDKAYDYNKEPGPAPDSGKQDSKELTRDQVMAKNIMNVLRKDPANKVVFWVGSLHLNSQEGKGSSDTKYNAAEILKRFGVKISTVTPLWYQGEKDSIKKVTGSVKEPTIVDTQNAKNIGKIGIRLTGKNGSYGQWNHVIVYPK